MLGIRPSWFIVPVLAAGSWWVLAPAEPQQDQNPDGSPGRVSAVLAGTGLGSFFDTIPEGSPEEFAASTPSILPTLIPSPANDGRLISLANTSVSGSSGSGLSGSSTHPMIRIGSFNANGLSRDKLKDPRTEAIVLQILASFDIVAIQEIRSRPADLMLTLVEQLNKTGKRYDFLIGPEVGVGGLGEHFAFIFDVDRIETDRTQLYTMNDPLEAMTYDPLVGWFRAKSVDVREAFTFSLANIRLNEAQLADEQSLLPEVVRGLFNDGRGEDDVMLIGTFEASGIQLENAASVGMVVALDATATDTQSARSRDNILLPSKATDEFTGRAGTLDFLRQHNLSIEQATTISDHLPIWGDFYAKEGGRTP